MPSNTTQRSSGSGSGKGRRGGGKAGARQGPASRAAKPSAPGTSSGDAADPAVVDVPLDGAPTDVESVPTVADADGLATGTAADAGSDVETGPTGDAVDESAAEAADEPAGAATATRSSGAVRTGAKATTAKAGAAEAGAAKAGATKAGGAKAGTTKAGAAKSGPARKGATPVKGGGGRGRGPTGRRGPVKPVKPARPWGLIALGVAVGLVALSIIGYGVWFSWDSGKPFGERRAQQIDGMVNYRVTDEKSLTRNHVEGKQTYKVSPPVGGDHNAQWENCEGDVFTTQVPNEHAVHSMEHGAIWITYRPGLPAAQVKELAEKVQGKNFMLMSPYPGLSTPVSVQAWGFQLKVQDADDGRIDRFIKQFRQTASVEPGATCSQGVTVTGTTPLPPQQPAPQGG